MRKADFEARISKIEIVNRVLSDRFVQAMRVVLDEVELSNEKAHRDPPSPSAYPPGNGPTSRAGVPFSVANSTRIRQKLSGRC